MYAVFNTAPRVGSTNISTIDLDYVRNVVMGEQVARYQEYRRVTPGIIKSDHLLLRILNSLNIEFDGDLFGYYNRVASQVGRLTGSMGMANSSFHGKVFDKGTFYGDDISEIIITAHELVDPRDIWNKWEGMSCVRALAHPIRGVGILELDGDLRLPSRARDSAQLAVLVLNIPLMACQYQLWKMSMRATSVNAGALPDGQFISSVVLPNLLKSHLDIAMLNSLSYQVGIDTSYDLPSNMPFYTTDVSTRLNGGISDLLDRFTSQTFTFPEILRNVPVYGANNLLEAVRLPDVATTNQVLWALTAARLPLVAFLLKLNSLNNNAKNDTYLTIFRRTLIEAQSGKTLENQVPRELAKYFAQFINERIEPFLQ